MQAVYQTYWHAFIRSTGHEPRPEEPFQVDEFGDNPALMDYLIGLVLEGKKTATCGLLIEYEWDQYPLPQVGQRVVQINGRREPVCITEVMEVETKPFCEIDAQFAYDEGEDDRTYASWHREHVKYFTRRLAERGLAFDEKMLTVCERFKVIYR